MDLYQLMKFDPVSTLGAVGLVIGMVIGLILFVIYHNIVVAVCIALFIYGLCAVIGLLVKWLYKNKQGY